MDFQRDHLTVKIKTLAAEARIIRHKEQSLKKRGPLSGLTLQRFESLRDHRKLLVRRESRHTQLAYAYLRGMPYRALEQTCELEPNWGLVTKNVNRFLLSGSARADNLLASVKAWGCESGIAHAQVKLTANPVHA
jgi:hypothetical protein